MQGRKLTKYSNVVLVATHTQVFLQVPKSSVSNVDSVEESQHVEKLQQRYDAPINLAQNPRGLDRIDLVAGSVGGSAFDTMNILLLGNCKAPRRTLGLSFWGRHREQGSRRQTKRGEQS